jgi:bifunctional non-homologous end joining protein LigD
MYAPQLATLVNVPPAGEGWWHEVKFDGYRIGCRIAGGRATLISRNGNDWTAAYPEIAEAALALPVRDALLDGEVAALLPDGRTSFQALQQHGAGGTRASLVYIVFDVLRLEGQNVEARPLEQRKALLERLVGAGPGRIRCAEHVGGSGPEFLARACRLGYEGIVSKRVDRPYHHGRSHDWLKSKCIRRQEFVVGGFTDPEGTRAGLGALLVGHYDGARLVFAGKVGTGFTQAFALDLRRRLEGLRQTAPPFDPPPPRGIARRAHYVRPDLVCEVTFGEWTDDGMIRHPVFQGLRADKKPRDVRREREREQTSSAALAAPSFSSVRALAAPSFSSVRALAAPSFSSVRESAAPSFSSPARYYEAVAAWMLPHVRGRPLTLLRRRGSAASVLKPPARLPSHVNKVLVPGASGQALLAVDDVAGILNLVAIGAVEFDTWNAGTRDLARPDRLLIGLDPGGDVTWPRLADAARHLRSIFRALDLDAYCKTTGGRGLHVVVPLVPQADWSECLAFARALCEAMVRTDPDALTTRSSGAGRASRVLVDYRLNEQGRASIAAFSTCARHPASVAVPVAWTDLRPGVSPETLTTDRVAALFSRSKKDPWAGYWASRQKLTKQRRLAVARHRT